MKHKVLLLLLSAAMISIAGFALFKQSDRSNGNKQMVDIQKKTNTNTIEDGETIQAWIYPGPPACDAMKEIQDGRKIDVLKPEYFKVAEDGNIKFLTEEDEGCNAFSQTNLELVKQYSKQQYITVASNHIDMRILFADQNKVEKAIDILATFAQENSVTGIELDFEEFSAWTKKDYADYKAFAQKLAEKLHQNNNKLMIDGPALTSDMQQYYFWKYEDFKNHPVDYVVVMAYDYQYDHGKGNFIAPNAWVKEVVNYTIKGLGGVKKLIVGLPSYGYNAEQEFKFALDTKQQSLRHPGAENAAIDNSSYESWWELGETFYVIQTTEGLKKKVQFIKGLGVQHISVWHLGGNDWIE